MIRHNKERGEDLNEQNQNYGPGMPGQNPYMSGGPGMNPTGGGIPVYVSQGPDARVEPYYAGTEEEVLGKLLKRELEKIGYKGEEIAPIRKKKMVLTAIFAVITAIWVILTKFRAGGFFTFLEIVALILYFIFLHSYDTMDYVEKEVKARPDDDISNIVAGLVAGSLATEERFDSKGRPVKANRFDKWIRLAVIVAGLLLPQFLFITPHIMYEKADSGRSYHVRFYTAGWIDDKKVEIPSTHKGKPVTGMRGNVFEGLELKEIILPDTMETIRGHAFEGVTGLTNIDLPENLTYLGGGAFKDCTSLKEIVLPDTLTDVGGETFSGCKSLQSVVLPSEITEIHGNTFENCSSLKAIEIPEGVTRIGGHAFYGCKKLEDVSVPSTVREIGSSAFRMCSSLETIELPNGCDVNYRAFKESPTEIHWY